MTQSENTIQPETQALTKHTPGPWHINGYNLAQVIKVKEGPDRQGRAYVDGRQQEVVANVGCDNEMTWSERHANARLIATAPELLTSLTDLLACSELNMDDMENATIRTLHVALSTIAKARGVAA